MGNGKEDQERVWLGTLDTVEVVWAYDMAVRVIHGDAKTNFPHALMPTPTKPIMTLLLVYFGFVGLLWSLVLTPQRGVRCCSRCALLLASPSAAYFPRTKLPKQQCPMCGLSRPCIFVFYLHQYV